MATRSLLEGGTMTTHINWHPEGGLFVPNIERFAARVLPVHFPEMKAWGSFVKQLNNYGFEKRNRVSSTVNFAHGSPLKLITALDRVRLKPGILIGTTNSGLATERSSLKSCVGPRSCLFSSQSRIRPLPLPTLPRLPSWCLSPQISRILLTGFPNSRNCLKLRVPRSRGWRTS